MWEEKCRSGIKGNAQIKMMQFGCNSRFSANYMRLMNKIRKKEIALCSLSYMKEHPLLSMPTFVITCRKKKKNEGALFLFPEFQSEGVFFLTKRQHQNSNFQRDNKSPLPWRQTNTACVMDSQAVKMWEGTIRKETIQHYCVCQEACCQYGTTLSSWKNHL